MDLDARSGNGPEVKAEDDSGDTRMAEERPTYRSWKKKYRKMRIVFDQKMHDGEDLHRLEQKALATARRLAIQKDRLLDLLLDVNNSAQIPTEKRFDLRLDPPSDDDAPCLDMDRPSTPPPGARPAKSYKNLVQDVPHISYSAAAERFPGLLADLEAGRDSPADPTQGMLHPPSFLTADEIDNYLWEIDMRLGHEDGAKTGGPFSTPLPSLAPLAQAHANGTSASNGTLNGSKDSATVPLSSTRDFALRNPTSVYNWLRKHAPKTFLQDAETHTDKDKGGDHDDHHHTPSGRGGHGRGAKGERGGSGRGGSAAGALRTKRMSKAAAAAAAAAASHTDDYDDDLASYEMTTPTVGGGKGKRKRIVDDDPGYRPKGGSSRPTKKKRKSEVGGGGDSTPTAPGPKRSRKSGGTHVDSSKGGDD